MYQYCGRSKVCQPPTQLSTAASPGKRGVYVTHQINWNTCDNLERSTSADANYQYLPVLKPIRDCAFSFGHWFKQQMQFQSTLTNWWWIPDFFLFGGWGVGGWPDRMMRQSGLSDSFSSSLNSRLNRPWRGGWLATQPTPPWLHPYQLLSPGNPRGSPLSATDVMSKCWRGKVPRGPKGGLLRCLFLKHASNLILLILSQQFLWLVIIVCWSCDKSRCVTVTTLLPKGNLLTQIKGSLSIELTFSLVKGTDDYCYNYGNTI